MALLDSMMGMQGFSPMQRLQVLGPVAMAAMQRPQPGQPGGLGNILQALLAARQQAGGMLPARPNMPPNITPGMLPGQGPVLQVPHPGPTGALPMPMMPPPVLKMPGGPQIAPSVPPGYQVMDPQMVNLGFGGVRY